MPECIVYGLVQLIVGMDLTIRYYINVCVSYIYKNECPRTKLGKSHFSVKSLV